VSTSSGFTPGASNLKAMNKSTRFPVEDLVPGTTYYAKIEIIDSSGNVSTTSAQETIVAGYVGAIHMNPDNEVGNLLHNPTLSNWSSPHVMNDDAPDSWVACQYTTSILESVIDDTLWRTAGGYDQTVYHESTIIKSTAVAVKLWDEGFAFYNGVGIKTLEAIPCSGDTLYEARWVTRRQQSGGPVMRVIVYDSTKTLLEIFNSVTPNFAIGTYIESYAYFRTAATARWIRIETNLAGTTVARTMYVDRMSLRRAQSSFRSQAAGATTYTNAWNRVAFTSTITDNGGDFSDPTFTALEEGSYSFEAVVGLTGLDASATGYASMQIALYISFGGAAAAAYVYSAIAENNSGAARDTFASLATRPIALAAGDTVEVYVWHDDAGGSPRTALIGNNTQFAGSKLS